MTDRSLKAEIEVFLKHSVQTCFSLIRTDVAGPYEDLSMLANAGLDKRTYTGECIWESTGLIGLNTQEE